jgi:hypothetical protein
MPYISDVFIGSKLALIGIHMLRLEAHKCRFVYLNMSISPRVAPFKVMQARVIFSEI